MVGAGFLRRRNTCVSIELRGAARTGANSSGPPRQRTSPVGRHKNGFISFRREFHGGVLYALGRRIFSDYESRFLKKRVETGLILRLAEPWNWVRMASPKFSTSDLAAEYHDHLLFKGATFGDLAPKLASIPQKPPHEYRQQTCQQRTPWRPRTFKF